jgi:hypothetical protein
MVSIRYFSGEAALSCWKVMPAVRAISMKLIRLCMDDQALKEGELTPAHAKYLRKARRETFVT